MFPSIRIKGPTVLREKQLQTITLPLPCFSQYFWYQTSYFLLLLILGHSMYLIPSDDSKLNLVSSLHKTLDHSMLVHSLCCFRNASLAFLLSVDIKDFLLIFEPRKPYSFRCSCIIEFIYQSKISQIWESRNFFLSYAR